MRLLLTIALFGDDKATGTMDPFQQATDAGDLHGWEMSMQ